MTNRDWPMIAGIGTARPGHDIHQAFVAWAGPRIDDERERRLFARMVERSGIEHRWSVLPPTQTGGSPVSPGGFYDHPQLPPTSARMAAYAEYAPALALEAIARLTFDPATVTHLVVASCTGFVAPGIDQIIARQLQLVPTVERTLIGFMRVGRRLGSRFLRVRLCWRIWCGCCAPMAWSTMRMCG